MRLRFLSSLCLALAALASFSTQASAATAFGRAAVVTTQSAGAADLVLLDAGYDAGLRAGMVCRVTRGESSIGELLLVELRPTAAAALILNLAPQQAIQNGDHVAVKILKS